MHSHIRARSSTTALVLGLLLYLLATPTLLAAGPTPGPALDLTALETRLDAVIPEMMVEYHVPGVAVAVIVDGQLHMSRGYGVADLERRTPVDPQQTLFRIGSASKLFTATAIMQLVERGQLGLDDEVNAHLTGFQLPATYAQAVTVRHLLTHTAGLDEAELGMQYLHSDDAMKLSEFLAKRMPARVMPPGYVTSYSNSGFSLLGLLIEEISGMSLEEYMQEHIYQPLGMDRSTFVDPPELVAELATGYFYVDGTYRAVPYDYLHLYPAGAMKATVLDVSRWLVAMLNGGAGDAGRIMQPETVELMQSQQFTHHPALPGWACGLYERYHNGMRVLEHGGNYAGYMNNALMVPELGIGFFFSYNQNDRRLYRALTELLLDAALPAGQAATVVQPPAERPSYYVDLVGSYRHNRYARNTIEKLQVLGREMRVSFDTAHVLVLQPPPGEPSPATRWVEIEPYLFREEGGQTHLTFLRDSYGEVTHLILGTTGHTGAFERLAWQASTPFQLALIGLCLVGFLAAGVGWPVARMLRRSKVPTTGTPRWARRLGIGTALLNLVFLPAFLITTQGASIYGWPQAIVPLLTLPLISALATAVMVTLTLMSWVGIGVPEGQPGPRVMERLAYTGLTIVCTAYLWFLGSWNLIGFQL